jgi:hypothetical protein
LSPVAEAVQSAEFYASMRAQKGIIVDQKQKGDDYIPVFDDKLQG